MKKYVLPDELAEKGHLKKGPLPIWQHKQGKNITLTETLERVSEEINMYNIFEDPNPSEQEKDIFFNYIVGEGGPWVVLELISAAYHEIYSLPRRDGSLADEVIDRLINALYQSVMY